MVGKLEPKKHFRHFCFCLGLRLGTTIISALWMIGGIALTIGLTVSIKAKQGTSMDAYHYKLTIVLIFNMVLAVCVGVYGLYGSANKFTGKNIKIYKGAAWTVQVGMWCTLCFVRMVLFLATKNDFYSWCYASCSEQQNNTACDGQCERSVHLNILRMFMESTFTIAFNIYSALIISVYAKQLVQKRETIKLTKRDSLASTVPFHFPSRNNSLFREQEAAGLEMRELRTDFFPSPRTSVSRTPPSKLHAPSIYHPNYTAPYHAPFAKSNLRERQDCEEAVASASTTKDFQFAGGEEADENMETIIDNNGITFDTYHSKTGTEPDKEGGFSLPLLIVSPASPVSKEFKMPCSWELQEQLIGTEDITSSLR